MVQNYVLNGNFPPMQDLFCGTGNAVRLSGLKMQTSW